MNLYSTSQIKNRKWISKIIEGFPLKESQTEGRREKRKKKEKDDRSTDQIDQEIKKKYNVEDKSHAHKMALVSTKGKSFILAWKTDDSSSCFENSTS